MKPCPRCGAMPELIENDTYGTFRYQCATNAHLETIDVGAPGEPNPQFDLYPMSGDDGRTEDDAAQSWDAWAAIFAEQETK